MIGSFFFIYFFPLNSISFLIIGENKHNLTKINFFVFYPIRQLAVGKKNISTNKNPKFSVEIIHPKKSNKKQTECQKKKK